MLVRACGFESRSPYHLSMRWLGRQGHPWHQESTTITHSVRNILKRKFDRPENCDTVLSMDIEVAIKILTDLQKAGVKHVVAAVWDASSFDLQEDDQDWPYLSVAAEFAVDWSNVRNQMNQVITKELNLLNCLNKNETSIDLEK